MIVTAPASSANCGPGFDALALAVDLPFTFAVGQFAGGDLLRCEPSHPAVVAYREAGGVHDDLWWRSPIPPGRGLGFSGAARAAGALAGAVEVAGVDDPETRQRALEVAARLERHPENAAASMLGGFVVAAAGHAVRIPADLGNLRLLLWWPRTETSTRAARRLLPAQVPFDDAVFNVGRASLLVAALSNGRFELLHDATEDRLHTDPRLAANPVSRPVLDAWRAAPGVLAAWLSGSGPTVAALVRPGDAEEAESSVESHEGTTRVVGPASTGAAVEWQKSQESILT